MDGGDAAGGSAELARLIDKCGEALLADFQHHYQIDLRDVLRPGSGLSPRRALALVRQLPLESATVAALRGGPEFRGWGTDRYLLAMLIDAVNDNTFAFISANSKRKPQPPKPVERPGKAAQKNTNPNSFRAIAKAKLAALKRKKGGNGERPGN
ncbi:D site-binding protein [Amycolatopsis anabasis]|uniref:D site-binding protein n=1 Tax=Amycolatopsis anabasis TaxID=1840409 RepID=UPI00131AA69F|nr:D site-binding protein [Amycolatopsis anabasis]